MTRKKFVGLRIEMLRKDVTQQDLARELHLSNGAVHNKFVGRSQFTFAEAYSIMDLLSLPSEQISTYFKREDILQ